MNLIAFAPIGLFILELIVLIKVGSSLGALATIFWLIASGVIGFNLVRLQGFHTLLQAQQRMRFGETPAVEMISGLLLSLAGVLFIFPGFVSDLLALPLLIPAVRRWILAQLINSSRFNAAASSSPFEQPQQGATQGHTIEGEYQRKDD